MKLQISKLRQSMKFSELQFHKLIQDFLPMQVHKREENNYD